MLIIFTGLAVMLYVQNIVREKHEAAEREKIHAVESSLAKSQFLFNMSHDIRTPMNAIIGYTNLALKEPAPPAVRDYLQKIDGSSRHLLALINDILEMSRIESGKVELEYAPVDLCAVFDGMRDLFSEQMKQKNELSGAYRAGAPPLCLVRSEKPQSGFAQHSQQRLQIHAGGRGRLRVDLGSGERRKRLRRL